MGRFGALGVDGRPPLPSYLDKVCSRIYAVTFTINGRASLKSNSDSNRQSGQPITPPRRYSKRRQAAPTIPGTIHSRPHRRIGTARGKPNNILFRSQSWFRDPATKIKKWPLGGVFKHFCFPFE